ncbi:hypothetical protein Q8A73_007426 [Channa argus]|nr:hypothetical protein Q8A73_007426 [Channa argus]
MGTEWVNTEAGEGRGGEEEDGFTSVVGFARSPDGHSARGQRWAGQLPSLQFYPNSVELPPSTTPTLADSQAIGSVQLPSSPPLPESAGLSLDTGEPEGVGAECKRIGCPNTPVKGRRAAESNSHEDEP